MPEPDLSTPEMQEKLRVFSERLRVILKNVTYESSSGMGQRHFKDHHIEAIHDVLLPLVIELGDDLYNE